ncbi:MAG: phenylalanine--tRNA ligase subunit beta [Bacteroidetes bacterium]|nr:MAG: phenylalanine--tRNA ligase subunit beta [Bacteroidota bacterium]
MNISLNWLKDYINIEQSPEKTGEILTDIGLEVEALNTVESIKGGLEGVVIGLVKTCQKHPNADKLSVTTVDIGSEELHIVCGAPNVAAGQKVLVATVGTTLYPSEGEPWTIKKGKIRGEVSEGMICAEDELGLGTDHSGIMVLPETAEVGMPARTYFQVENDVVYEIGLTPNRSDATCHLGVAVDLAAALKINYGGDGNIRKPSVDNFVVHRKDMPVEVVVENAEACPRYSGVVIKGVTIGESPDWLKNRLRAIGVRPISNIVDITNFILHELGQPLHAFDLDEIEGRKIIVKTLPEGAKFQSLDEVERTLSHEDLMICDGASNGMCIGGVFGGIKSGVKDSTQNIFLESAHFNAQWIRRTSTRHNLRTDAARVFEKGSDPNNTVYALKRAAMMMIELAGGEIASEIVDIYPNPIEPKQIKVTYEYINRLIGVDIEPAKVKAILTALEMDILSEDASGFKVSVPTNKADVTRPADIVEEILRIYGLNEVPVPTKINSSLALSQHPDPNRVKNIIADQLASNGFFEMQGLSLTENRYFKTVLPIPDSELVYINNTSNIHLDVMRPTMLFSGLEAILHNQNRQNPDLKLFEFGKSYRKKAEGGFDEKQHLTLFITGRRMPENWHAPQKQPVDFFTLKAFVLNILNRLGLGGVQESEYRDEVFQYGLKYHRGPQTLVIFGRVQPSIVKQMDIRNEVYYAEFEWDTILKAIRKSKTEFEEINKFPTVRRDLALVIDNSVKFADIVGIARKKGKKLIKDINLFDVYVDEEKLGAGKKSYAVSFTFEDPTKTLKDKEVDKVMKQLIEAYEQSLGAIIRR